MDLNNAGILRTDERITQRAIKDVKLQIHPAGTVLVAMYGGFNQIGRTGVLRIPAATNQAITAVLPNRTILDFDYLLQMLNYRVGYWRTVASSSRKDPNITKADVKAFTLDLPQLAEQEAIAAAINDADELIAALERQVAKKQALKQGMMQQLLTGRTRLPGFTEPWFTRSIGDFAEVKSGGTPSTAVPRYWGGDIRWMSSGEVHQKRVCEVRGRITTDGLRESSAQLLPVGTVLMALAGQGKTRATVAISRVELSTNQSIAGILPSSEHDAEFLYYNLDTRYDELRGESAGEGGRGGLNLTIIKNLKVFMPALHEQVAISGVLSDADDELSVAYARLEKARAIKQGMMQQLLTGRTRLPAQETAA
jgi:type I restriction enzyme, S subunit